MRHPTYLSVGYLPGYATNAKRGYSIASVPGHDLTHVVYAFSGFVEHNGTWQADYPEPKDEQKNFPDLLALRETYPHLQFLISLGGWNHSHQMAGPGKTVFSFVAASAAARRAFVQSCLERFIRRSPVLFTGIDIDWEFPAQAEKDNFVLLLEEFRRQLDAEGHRQGRRLLLTAAVGSDPTRYAPDRAHALVDWLNLMTYDFHGPGHGAADRVTDFNAPLYASPRDPNPGMTCDAFAQSYLRAGVPSRKLVLGIPAYAHAYAGATHTDSGLYQTYTGPGPGTYEPHSGILTYRDVMDHYLGRCGTSHWDLAAQASYLYCVKDGVFISFQAAGDVYAKAAYVDQHALGGLMLWELGADKTDQHPLTRDMADALHLH